ncbi:MAG: hypothetical protein D3910_05835 [Candidatus Electrothrix sp. ATG2]|nr:hypothetical protein [Candidatus Electrothrix sp. ATG2]
MSSLRGTPKKTTKKQDPIDIELGGLEMKGDFFRITIPFSYSYLRSYFPDSKRWGDKIHIVLGEEYQFKKEQVTVGKPICGVLEYVDPNNTALKPWVPGRKKSVRVCRNCVNKLLLENKLHIESE